MTEKQQSVIDENLVQIINALEPNTKNFLDYLLIRKIIKYDEEQIVDIKVTNKGKLIALFEILKQKDSAWPYLIQFFHDNGQTRFGKFLEASV